MIFKLQSLTIADWDAMPYRDGNRYEIIEGELFVSCSPGLTHERVALNLITNDRLTGPPTLVIEILSPGSANIRRDRVSKLSLYAKHGVPEYWIADPQNKTLDRFVRKGSSLVLLETLQHEGLLTTSVLPGFSGPVNSVFKPI
jgi:Uma2 family endonuclease